MRLKGKRIVEFDIEVVWAALNDPAHLEKAIPGCKDFQQTGDDCYSVAVNLGLGPVTGEYTGEMEVTEKNPPNSSKIRFHGSGLGAFVRVESRIELAEFEVDKTEVKWNSEAELGGKLLAAGDRVLIGVAELMLKQFFKRLETQLIESNIETAKGVRGKSVASGGRALISKFVLVLQQFFKWLKTKLGQKKTDETSKI